MMDTRQWIPIAGLLATIAGGWFGVAHLHAQAKAQAPAIDFTKATTVQVKNAQGQVVLQGDFQAPLEDGGDLERKATLASTGVDPDATGTAEIELKRADNTRQELEVSVRNVDSGANFTFVIDGIGVGAAMSDRRGRAELDIDARRP